MMLLLRRQDESVCEGHNAKISTSNEYFQIDDVAVKA